MPETRKTIVSLPEAAILLVLADDEPRSVFELSGSTHYSLSRVRDVLSRLRERKLAEMWSDNNWKLTYDGERVRNWLAHRWGSSSSPGYVLSEHEFPTEVPSDETALDAALDQALNRRQS